jgi:hypothetical protein
VDKINFLWRLRLFIGGEIIRLGGWITPTVEDDSGGCDEQGEWVIHSLSPDNVTYCCTFHLPDMVTTDTAYIEPFKHPEIGCHYLYSTEAET